jgi:hypothetical protein
MATVTETRAVPDPVNAPGVWTVTWVITTANLDGQPIDLSAFPDKTVHITGTFSGDTLTMQGSNDPAARSTPGSVDWQSLRDPQGGAIAKTAAYMGAILENPRFVRPLRTGTAGGQPDGDPHRPGAGQGMNGSAPMTAREAGEAIGPLVRALAGLQRGEELMGVLVGADQEIAERMARIAKLAADEDARLAANQADRDRIAAEEQAARERIAAEKAADLDAVAAEAARAKAEVAAAQSDLAEIQAATEAARKARSDAEASVKAAQDEAWQKIRAVQDDTARSLAALEQQVADKRAALDAEQAKLDAVQAARAELLAKLGA